MKKIVDEVNVVNDATISELPLGEVNVMLILAEDGVHLVDNGEDKGLAQEMPDGVCYKLPKNAANRTWFSVKKINDAKSKGISEINLEYRASRKYGSIGTKLPNAKLIAYLPEDLQAEYKAIVDRAIAARDAAKSKPMTELEKAETKVAKAKAAYEKLLQQANENN